MNEVNKLIWPADGGVGYIDPAAWDRTAKLSQETKNLEGSTVLTKAPDAEAYTNDIVTAAHAVLEDDGHRHQRCRLRTDRRSPSPRAAPEPSSGFPIRKGGSLGGPPFSRLVARGGRGAVVVRRAVEHRFRRGALRTDDAGPLTFLAIRMAHRRRACWAGCRHCGRRCAPTSSAGSLPWVVLAGLGMHAAVPRRRVPRDQLGHAVRHRRADRRTAPGDHRALPSRRVLGERLRRVQWIGVALGFVGVIVVVRRSAAGQSAGVTLMRGRSAAGLSVLGMSAGTLVQRRHGHSTPLLWGTAAAVPGVGGGRLAPGVRLVHDDEGFTATARVGVRARLGRRRAVDRGRADHALAAAARGRGQGEQPVLPHAGAERGRGRDPVRRATGCCLPSSDWWSRSLEVSLDTRGLRGSVRSCGPATRLVLCRRRWPMTDTAERPDWRADSRNRSRTVVVRFAGDSGDGMQLTGDRFTSASATVRQRPVDVPRLPGRDPCPSGHGQRRVELPGAHLATTTSRRPATRRTCWWR